MSKTIYDYDAALTIDGATHWLLIQPGDNSVDYNRINRNVFLGVTGQPADISTIQSFTNKTLDNTNTITIKDSLFTLQDNSDTTKQAQFQLSGITTATTRTYTLPNASSTLADIATAQTFTNKTLTAPVISGGTIDNSTITVDAIGEHTSANGVTIDGLNIKDGALNTNNSVVTNNITDAAVTPAKLIAGTGSGWTWQSWSPTWTNFTPGNATTDYKYIQVGKTVYFRIQVTLGTTSSMSTTPTFTLPITSIAYASTLFPFGQANMTTNAAGWHNGVCTYVSTTTACFRSWDGNSDGQNVSSTIPFTWATNYGFFIEGFYEAA